MIDRKALLCWWWFSQLNQVGNDDRQAAEEILLEQFARPAA